MGERTLDPDCFLSASRDAANGFIHRGVIREGPLDLEAATGLLRPDAFSRSSPGGIPIDLARANDDFKTLSQERAEGPQLLRSDLQPVSRCGMVAVNSTSLPADWRQAATPKHTVSVNVVSNSSTDRNWLTRTPSKITRERAHIWLIRKMQSD